MTIKAQTEGSGSYSREDAIEQLRAVRDGTYRERFDSEDKEWYSPPPSEGAHLVADSILLRLIGDREISDLFHSIEKWYA